MPVSASISLMPDAVVEAQRFLEEHGEKQSLARLDKVQRLIEGFETPYGMELLATVHWVSMHVENPPASVEEAIPRVQEWSSRKAELFTPKHIQKTYSGPGGEDANMDVHHCHPIGDIS